MANQDTKKQAHPTSSTHEKQSQAGQQQNKSGLGKHASTQNGQVNRQSEINTPSKKSFDKNEK